MHSKSCSCCLEWTASDETVGEALRGRWRARENCAHQSLMHVAIEQLKKGIPTWWVVGGTVIVPIWAVELLKKRARLLASPGVGLTAHNQQAIARGLR